MAAGRMGVERHLPDKKALEAIDTVGTAQLLARAQIVSVDGRSRSSAAAKC
jgi:hypothetical protein